MKENVLEVLMYLFENYMDEENSATHPDRDSLRTELVEAGFGDGEVDKALAWLDGLSELQRQSRGVQVVASRAMRIFNQQELDRLDTECRGFLTFLDQIGVLDQPAREMVIDRLMALESDDIDLDHVKWVVLMVLFNQPGREAAYAWIEDLVFQETRGFFH
ncbi:MAG: DUF494 family protein [Gammaproteobacteria bacterium]|nr:DUF494 family protein [Gammaproteobacteria bacterium]